MEPSTSAHREPTADAVRAAEAALARLGYQRVASTPPGGPNFWVQEIEVPKRTFPVFLWDGPLDQPVTALNTWRQAAAREGNPGRAIVVVPSERAAEAALDRGARKEVVEAELAVLVVPKNSPPAQAPRWHALVLPRREVLDLSTGIVVGLFRRAQAMEGSSEIDFQELLQLLRRQFRVDLNASLGVESDEAVLFMLYQMARKYGFAPGDPSANLHLLVLRPTGPASRLPWFAA